MNASIETTPLAVQAPRHDQDPWTDEHSVALIGALVRIVDDDPSPRARDVLELACDTVEWSGPRQPASPQAFESFRGSRWAEVAFMALVVAACVKQKPLTAADVRCIEPFAQAAGIDRVWMRVIRHASAGRGHRVTLNLARHAPDGRRVLQAARQQSGPAIFTILRTMVGRPRPDDEMGWWFRQLGLLPEGTVGRTFWENMTSRKLRLPGEPHGLPEAAVHHDLMHTLTGYGTDAAGECAIGGFYAGMLYPGWPAWIFAGLTTFELGLRVGPSFTQPTTGAFDPRRVFAAAKRGYLAHVRPLDDWDYRPLMELRLDVARERLGLNLAGGEAGAAA